jgi:hypothetical protein
MTPLAKQYLKIFLVLGLPFALGMSGFDLVLGDGFDLWRFLFMFVFFGGFMSLFLVGLQRYHLKKAGVKTFESDSFRVSQHRELSTILSKDAVKQLLTNDPVFGNMQISDGDHEIRIVSGFSWKSWGETIRLRFAGAQGIEQRIEIDSKPRVTTTVADYGKNKENVDRLVRLLDGDQSTSPAI